MRRILSTFAFLVLSIAPAFATIPGSMSPSCPASTSFFARASSNIAAALAANAPGVLTWEAAVDTLICNQVAGGTWATKDVEYLTVAPTKALAEMNLVSASYTMAPNASVTFVANGGMTGGAGAAGSADTGYTPSSGQMTPSSALVGACVLNPRTTLAANSFLSEVGTGVTGNYFVLDLLTAAGPSQASLLMAGGGAPVGPTSTTLSSTQGGFWASRTSATGISAYVNGSLLGTAASTAPALTGIGDFFILGLPTSGLTDTLGAVVLGAGETSAQVAADNTLLNNALHAMGTSGCDGLPAPMAQNGASFPAPDTSMCVTPPTTFNHVWYVNPTLPTGGNGSQASPWNSIPTALSNAVGGDEILLMNGTAAQYGDLLISGSNPSQFITIAAAPGQTPTLDSLRVSNSSLLAFSGFSVQRVVKSTIGIVSVVESGGANITHDIDFDHVAISSAPYSVAAGWTQAQWTANASPGFTTQRSSASGMYCVNMTHSHIFDTQFQAAQLFSNNSYFLNNELDHTALDTIDVAADNVVVRFNSLHDLINLGGNNHADFLQFFPSGYTEYHDIWVDSNTMIMQVDPALPFLPFVVVNGGIDITDQDWTDIVITNNDVVMTNHAMNLGSCHNCLVAGNTALMGSLTVVPVAKDGEGATANTNFVVRNNLVTLLAIADPNVIVDHNVIAAGGGNNSLYISGSQQFFSTPAAYAAAGGPVNSNIMDTGGILSEVTAYDPTTTITYDFHLLSTAPARGAGTTTAPIPTFDITGYPRAPTHDAGAYAFH